ncbi:MAG TPA: hypothetical protein VHV78_08170 [Gemmatimonadaceae bacterium]|nr:hypothetical protein [Gemmatimonadaceae bacterium]
MSERHKPHNGRDLAGHFRVREEDVDDLLADPVGPDLMRDDIRLGGAVADTGLAAGSKAREIEHLIDDNRDDVRRATRTGPAGGSQSSRSGRRKG